MPHYKWTIALDAGVGGGLGSSHYTFYSVITDIKRQFYENKKKSNHTSTYTFHIYVKIIYVTIYTIINVILISIFEICLFFYIIFSLIIILLAFFIIILPHTRARTCTQAHESMHAYMKQLFLKKNHYVTLHLRNLIHFLVFSKSLTSHMFRCSGFSSQSFKILLL